MCFDKMNKERILNAKKLIGKEIVDNLELSGKRVYYYLCQAMNYLTLYIKESENPSKLNQRMFE